VNPHLAMQKNFLVPVYPSRGLVFVRGEGVCLIDSAGDSYLDMMSNYGASILGYGHPGLNEALGRQLQALPSLHCSFANDTRADASRRLVQRISNSHLQIFWSNSGAESVEAALKLAVMATGKRKFIACRQGFHGKTLGALSATDGDKYRDPFRPLLWQFTHVPFDNVPALEGAIDDDTAGFIVEPIQGEGGLFVPRPGYLREARQVCTRRGILLMVDEIQTGAGRTGSFTVCAEDKVDPDILCLGKGLAGGLPVGVTAVRPDISARAVRSIHTSTFGGNPPTCAGVNFILDYLDAAALRRITELGSYFRERLLQLEDHRIRAVRGKGLMIGIDVGSLRDEVLKGLQQERILAIPAGADVVRFLPPYIIEKVHIDRATDALQSVLRKAPGS
jgi:acetylornithine/succinyldiaminopimelate/putrescine aminotransferase